MTAPARCESSVGPLWTQQPIEQREVIVRASTSREKKTMCQAKPGNRCSAHASKTLAKAQAAYDASPSQDTFDALQDALREYDTTPEGQGVIKRAADAATSPEARQALLDRARRAEVLHEQRAKAYKVSKVLLEPGEAERLCDELEDAYGREHYRFEHSFNTNPWLDEASGNFLEGVDVARGEDGAAVVTFKWTEVWDRKSKAAAMAGGFSLDTFADDRTVDAEVRETLAEWKANASEFSVVTDDEDAKCSRALDAVTGVRNSEGAITVRHEITPCLNEEDVVTAYQDYMYALIPKASNDDLDRIAEHPLVTDGALSRLQIYRQD